jgi:hypothetical protein
MINKYQFFLPLPAGPPELYPGPDALGGIFPCPKPLTWFILFIESPLGLVLFGY